MIDINTLTPYPVNNSWVVSLLKNLFKSTAILDPWNNPKTLKYLETEIPKIDFLIYDNAIICIDDETFEVKEDDLKKIFIFIKNYPFYLDKLIFIFKTRKLFNIAKEYNIKSILFPYFDIMEDLIAFNKLKEVPSNQLNYNDNESFLNLNGTYNIIRYFLLDTLERYSLIKSGYVTCNFRLELRESILRKIKIDKFAEEVYFNTNKFPCDRLFHEYKNIPCTLNLKNYFYISENVPGSIYLSVESCASENIERSLRSPSDKTFLPFICKRLPLIIGDFNKMEILKEEGFDIFDDILDHSYSKISINNYEKKVIRCIESNYEILKENNLFSSDEINDRLNKNQEFLLNDWFNMQINDFVENIKSKMN